MERIENIYEVTQRLCGMIEPYGDSNIDETRYKNLEQTIDVTEKLIRDIIIVASFKWRHEASIKKIGERADDFISNLREQLTP